MTKELWKRPAYREAVESKSGKGKFGYYSSIKNSSRIHYQSSYELKAYEMLELDSTVIRYQRCPYYIPYIYLGEEHNYHPDILVFRENGCSEVIEIKAAWQLDHPLIKENLYCKINAAREYLGRLGINYSIWTEKELME